MGASLAAIVWAGLTLVGAAFLGARFPARRAAPVDALDTQPIRATGRSFYWSRGPLSAVYGRGEGAATPERNRFAMTEHEPTDPGASGPDWPALDGAAVTALRAAARELEAAQREAAERFLRELEAAHDRLRQRLATIVLGFDPAEDGEGSHRAP